MPTFFPNCVFKRLVCDPETFVSLMHCGVMLRDADSFEQNVFGSKLIEFLKSDNVAVKDKF